MSFSWCFCVCVRFEDVVFSITDDDSIDGIKSNKMSAMSVYFTKENGHHLLSTRTSSHRFNRLRTKKMHKNWDLTCFYAFIQNLHNIWDIFVSLYLHGWLVTRVFPFFWSHIVYFDSGVCERCGNSMVRNNCCCQTLVVVVVVVRKKEGIMMLFSFMRCHINFSIFGYLSSFP